MRVAVTNKMGKLRQAMSRSRVVLEKNLPVGVVEQAKILFAKSQELVPLDTLALKESGRILVGGTGFDATAYVGYGGDPFSDEGVLKTVVRKDGTSREVLKVPAEYAWYQHTYPMNHPNGGQDNYLSDPARDAGVLAEMSRAIRNCVGA